MRPVFATGWSDHYRWLYVPLRIVYEQEAKHDCRTKLDQLDEADSSTSDDSDSTSGIRGRLPRGSQSAGAGAGKAVRGGGGGGRRRGRYQDDVSSGSAEPDNMSDFIVGDDDYE